MFGHEAGGLARRPRRGALPARAAVLLQVSDGGERTMIGL